MKKFLIIILALSSVIFFVSCNKKNSNDKTSVDIYYLNNSKNKIVSELYQPVARSKEGLARELLSAMNKEPKDISFVKALPDSLIVKDLIFMKDDRLTVDLNSSYSELDPISEVLCRASIVKTLSQIEDLKYIELTVNGQPIKDSYDKLIGAMTKDDFISSTSMETSYKTTLYFANEDGTALLSYNTSLNYVGSNTIEEMVVQSLINGPQVEGYYKTIPENTEIISVITKDGVTYVNLNENFLDKTLNVADAITIYSIVNSLVVEIPHINKVQFLINGEIRKLYRENIDFDDFFERNLSLIDGEK
ncbi:MAG TPA: GerMN domain-containing protein [Clostridiales bacterium]|nr:GerMN domain-containing protein [Clostridiales bacterium]